MQKSGEIATTQERIFGRLKGLITEVTGIPAEGIAMDSVLITDLGAESIDLLDLSFLIEEEFSVTIEGDELEKQAREQFPGMVYEKEGFLTEEALGELRKLLPEVDPRKLTGRVRRMDVPALLTVSVLVRIIHRKIASKGQGENHA